MAMKFYRVGRRGGYWSGGDVSFLDVGTMPELWFAKNTWRGLRFNFAMSAAGGGDTKVIVGVSPESFTDVAHAMVKADREAAIRAFGSALLEPVEGR